MHKKRKKLKKLKERRIEADRTELQSFYYVGSIPELIILTVFIILVAAYFGVFSADGIIFSQILAKEKKKEIVPDKNQVVRKLEAEKTREGVYPLAISVIGVKKKYGTTRIDYVSSGQEFELCYAYFPYIENSSSCYKSQNKQWH